MSVKISDIEERNKWLKERYDSREYWIFLVDRNFYSLLSMIEDNFYNSDVVKGANADFEISFSASEPLSIATGHKRRMSKEQLKTFFKSIGAKGFSLTGESEYPEDKDILLLFKPTPEAIRQFQKITDAILAKKKN